MPASAKACSAAASAKRCERLANLSSLRSVANRIDGEALDLRGDARRKTACIEQRDRRGAAAACEQGIPGRGDVVADRRDQADARNGDAASMTTHAAGPCHGPAPNSTREVAMVFPSNLAESATRKRAVVLRRRIGAEFDRLSRRREGSHLDVGHASQRKRSCRRQRRFARKRRRQAHLRVEHQRRREHGPPRKVITKERRRARAPATWRVSIAPERAR